MVLDLKYGSWMKMNVALRAVNLFFVMREESPFSSFNWRVKIKKMRGFCHVTIKTSKVSQNQVPSSGPGWKAKIPMKENIGWWKRKPRPVLLLVWPSCPAWSSARLSSSVRPSCPAWSSARLSSSSSALMPCMEQRKVSAVVSAVVSAGSSCPAWSSARRRQWCRQWCRRVHLALHKAARGVVQCSGPVVVVSVCCEKKKRRKGERIGFFYRRAAPFSLNCWFGAMSELMQNN